MKNIIKTVLTFLSILLGTSLGIISVSAAELTGSGIIDSVTFTDSQLSQGQVTSLKVTFSEKKTNSINPGDTFTISIPSGLEGMVETGGAPRKINLSNLGTALVYKDRVVATFNENVKNLNNISGNFSFGLTSSVTNSEHDNTIQTDFGLGLPSQKVTIKGIPKNPGTGVLPFFYKSGDLLGDSNTVRWFLNANLNKADLHNDIVITDTHGAGQELNKDSFKVVIDNYLGSRTYSITDFIAKGFGTIEFKSDNTFVIRIRREHARMASVTVMYTSNITEKGKNQKEFTNDYAIDYQLWNKQPVSEKNTSHVKNLFANGEANGDLDNNHATEEEIDIPEETVESIEDITSETAESTEVEDNTTRPSETDKPIINVGESSEDITEETIDSIEDISSETAESTEVEDNTTKPSETDKPIINVGESSEEVTEETIDSIEDVTEETVESTEVEDNTTKPSETDKPIINVGESSEDITEETIGSIEDITSETADSSEVEDNTTRPSETDKPIINVGETTEEVTEETIGSIEDVTSETVESSEVEDNTDNTVEITQPEINVGETTEVITEETVETIDEVTPETTEPSIVEESTTNPSKVVTEETVENNGQTTESTNQNTVTSNEKNGVIKSTTNTQSSNTLPKTGSKQSISTAILGLVLSAATAFGLIIRYKK